jgi:hypothetical protein
MGSPKLTVLSFGGGQDSSVLLEMYLRDRSFRDRYAPNDFLVVMSDTGDEFEQTYKHVASVQRRCAELGVEFVFLKPSMGYHSPKWLSLRHFYRTHKAIGSKAFPKTCTDRLKIRPIYAFLEDWIAARYGVQPGRKEGFRRFASRYGKINMMLGIAKGEESRISDSAKDPRRWYRESIQSIYPLVDLGLDRAACQSYLHGKGLFVIPSNCKCCPFLSLEELEYLRRFHPDDLEDWIGLEAAKLEKHRDKSSVIVTDSDGVLRRNKRGQIVTKNLNYGVFGVTPLRVKVQEALEKFADWSDRDIADYRYSHGHCVASVY